MTGICRGRNIELLFTAAGFNTEGKATIRCPNMAYHTLDMSIHDGRISFGSVVPAHIPHPSHCSMVSIFAEI